MSGPIERSWPWRCSKRHVIRQYRNTEIRIHPKGIRDEFLYGDLPGRLGKYHSDVQGAFWGWATVWLQPEFPDWDIRSLLSSIKCPALVIQGCDDQYGSMAQIDGILAALPMASALKLSDCAHSPHIDQAAAVTEAIGRFLLTIRPGIQ